MREGRLSYDDTGTPLEMVDDDDESTSSHTQETDEGGCCQESLEAIGP